MIVAHFKDHFLLPSETFISSLISSLENTDSVILDRYPPAHSGQPLRWQHFSPATGLGRAGSWIERATLRFFSRSFYLENVLRTRKVQIVHAHFGQLGAAIIPVTRRLGLPLVTSFYGKDASVFATDPGWEKRFRELWRSGSRFLVVGPSMRAHLVGIGCPEENTHILPLALDLSVFPYSPRSSMESVETCEILSVGRLIPKKGMDVLIRAAARLGPVSPFRVRIVGDGPERPRLQDLVNQLGLSEHVTILGWRTPQEICRLMLDSHIFVLASRTDPGTGETEGTPTVLLEAQASGLPVVSTVHADIPAIVGHDESGFLVPESDPGALAEAIGRLIDDPGLRQSMGETGRNFVEEVHDRKVVGPRLEEIYRRLLG